MFSCAPYIKEIGRGKEGARSLTESQAHELFAAMLAGQVSELELGAVLLSFRVKGETTDELVGFCRASTASVVRIAAPPSATAVPIVIPSYNGARRRPNLTPLLAGLLAREGHPVLVHGLEEDPTGRVTSLDVFKALGWPVCNDSSQIDQALRDAHSQGLPLFVPLNALHSGLANLIAKRAILGVRNSAHTVVKFLQPFSGPALLLASYTHPEFWHLQREVMTRLEASALVMRGHEGEPVAHPQRAPRMDGVFAGQVVSLHEGDATFVDTPDPNPAKDASATAVMTRSLLTGAPVSLPHGLSSQLKAIHTLIAHVHAV